MTYFKIINIIAILLCFIDKKKAIHNRYRIKESTLLFVSVLGGCFGMLVGMYLFHHKTKKTKFKLVHLLCIIWLLILYKFDFFLLIFNSSKIFGILS